MLKLIKKAARLAIIPAAAAVTALIVGMNPVAFAVVFTALWVGLH